MLKQDISYQCVECGEYFGSMEGAVECCGGRYYKSVLCSLCLEPPTLCHCGEYAYSYGIREHFEKGCLCVLNGDVEKAPKELDKDSGKVWDYYNSKCKCGRGYTP